MLRLLPCLLLPVLTLAACTGNNNSAPASTAAPAAPSAPAAAAGPAAGVNGFDVLAADGSTIGLWSFAGGTSWTVTNLADNSTGTVQETARSGCCVDFAAPDGAPMVADIQTMVLTMGSDATTGGSVTLPIGNVR